MKKKKTKAKTTKSAGKHPKYLFILYFLAILTLAILIVKPFLSTLIVTAIIAYVFYPLYTWFYKLTHMKSFSAMVLILMLMLLLSIPLLLVTGKLTQESTLIYSKLKVAFQDVDSLEDMCGNGLGFICKTYNFFDSTSRKFGLKLESNFAAGFSNIASGFVSTASDFILSIPNLLLHVFIGIFAMFYMFTDGKQMVESIKNALPMRKEHSERMLEHFNDIIYATIYGAIVIAMIQGAVATIGYFIFGVTSPILLGLLTVVASFIPFIGAALVWVPVVISMFINGLATDEKGLIMRAGGLLIWGILVGTIDNFIRPKVVGSRAKVHPLIILLGVFGGLALFGFAGIMIGPLILTFFIASLKIYEQEKEHIMI
ncbi:AI-2E family transporter [Nanoarchaeota archaeon]